MADSFDDTTDDRRPIFSEDAYMGALVIALAFPTLEELKEWWKAFMALWSGWDFDTSTPVMNPRDNILETPHSEPDWKSVMLGDLQPLRDTINVWVEALDKFKPFQQGENAVNSFAQMLIRKGKAFKAFAAFTRETLLRLIKAISQTGFWVLPIYGQGGTALVKSALKTRSGVPENIQSTAEKLVADSSEILTKMAADISSLAPDESFISPEHRNASSGYVQSMLDDASVTMEKARERIEQNPHGGLSRMSDELTADTITETPEEYKRALTKSQASITVFATIEDAEAQLEGLSKSSNHPIRNPNVSIYRKSADLPDPFVFALESKFDLYNPILTSSNEPESVQVGSMLISGDYSETYDSVKLIELSIKEFEKSSFKDGVFLFDFSNITDELEYESDLISQFITYWTEVLMYKSEHIYVVASQQALLDAVNMSNTVMEKNSEELYDKQKAVFGETGSKTKTTKGLPSLNEIGDTVSVPVPKITYDADGKPEIKYEDKDLGPRFGGTDYPDFAGMNNLCMGCMLLTGGPSEEVAQVLFNLIGLDPTTGEVDGGIGRAAGKTAAAGGVRIYEQGHNAANVFAHYPDNHEYSQAKEREKGTTTNY